MVAISGLTALQGLRDHGRIEPGQEVLIVGASGGVGTFAVQIAKAFGGRVTGVCGAAKVEMVRSIGAYHVIDYTREDFAEGDPRYDLILDIGGSSSLFTAPPRPHPQGDTRHRRRRRRWTMAGDSRPPAPGAPAVPVRGPEAGDVHLKGEPRGPDPPQGPHRGRHPHAGDRQDVPARRGSRGHPVSGRGTRSRKSRHHRVRRDMSWGKPHKVPKMIH